MNSTKRKKMRKNDKSNFDFESMMCDKYRFEIPVNYDDMQNKKLRIWNSQTNDYFIFSYSSIHTEKLTLNTFIKMLRQQNV